MDKGIYRYILYLHSDTFSHFYSDWGWVNLTIHYNTKHNTYCTHRSDSDIVCILQVLIVRIPTENPLTELRVHNNCYFFLSQSEFTCCILVQWESNQKKRLPNRSFVKSLIDLTTYIIVWVHQSFVIIWHSGLVSNTWNTKDGPVVLWLQKIRIVSYLKYELWNWQ